MRESELLQTIVRDLALVKQAVIGNGVKGLNQRMEEVEEYIKEHPRECPFLSAPSARKLSKRDLLFGIIGVVGVVGSLIVAVAK